MRIALVGPFSGPSLAATFSFDDKSAALPPGYPGAPLMTSLAQALIERGHEVAAVSTDYTTPVDELTPFRAFQGRGIRVYYCPQRPRAFRGSQGRRGRALDFFRLERECLRAAIADFSPDVVHAHWTYEFAWAALDSGFPALTTAHDSPAKVLRYIPHPYRLIRYLMARRVLARCRDLTAVSPDLARDLEPLTRARISVVANPVADDLLRAPGCNAASFEGKKVVMVLNGWGALKNGATALRAFALARREDPQLHLACMGSDFEGGGPAHRWALAERLTDGVEFCGPVPQSTLRARLQAGAALLHPSRLESFGMSVAEAMALGLPPIAGRLTPALSWLLDGGRVGVLVDVNDPHAIARELIALTRDQGRWQAISTGARARARELFAASAVAARFESLYAALLQSEPEARPAGRLDKVFSRAPS